jgi:hypothetical protein
MPFAFPVRVPVQNLRTRDNQVVNYETQYIPLRSYHELRIYRTIRPSYYYVTIIGGKGGCYTASHSTVCYILLCTGNAANWMDIFAAVKCPVEFYELSVVLSTPYQLLS